MSLTGIATAVWHVLNVWGQLADCREEHHKCNQENDQRKMEIAELRGENERLRDLFDVATMQIDMHGKIIGAGPNFCRLSGYTVEELVGQHIDMIIPYRVRVDHHKWVKDCLTGERQLPMGPRELEMRCKNGAAALVTVSLTPRPDGSGTKILADVKRRT